ncbi:flagellar hook-length control protein FliK [Limnohabitans sp. Hippo4]|uniref:flagellar hook-length control protein FliK n=1 Tax=Limnohabitans sp. Hippo4 TaxID=1826167 RepID=UPI000D3BB2AA|nr:flagellar hook-length control protein FliK [Limnohabitans sp. Hippo4]PUE35455.1 hypothetical protein B9Z46_10430 [Limnohabitans sp. Hippo4]
MGPVPLISGAEALVAPGRIHPIFLEGKLLPLQGSPAAELGLKDGQVIQATVRSQHGQPMLVLQGRNLPLPGLQPSQVGESIWLRAQGGTLVPVNAQPLVSRIASLLYRPSVNTELSQLFQPGTLDELLSKVQRPDLQAQWRGMQLSMAQLTPGALRQAMMGAMGAEIWLARGMQPPVQDTKQLLRKLIAEINVSGNVDEEVDGGVIEKLTQAVDDIEASQVQAVQAQAQQEVLFSMTLPFADSNPVELTVRRGPRQDGEQPVLTVNVHSKTEELGPVWLKTQLMNAQQIELTMWAENEALVAQARSRSYLLGDELRAAGLTMRAFSVVHGARPSEVSDWTPSGRGLVVDVSA